MILRLYNIYQTGKLIYCKILKPFYEELRKDAYATPEPPAPEKPKRKIKRNRIKTNHTH